MRSVEDLKRDLADMREAARRITDEVLQRDRERARKLFDELTRRVLDSQDPPARSLVAMKCGDPSDPACVLEVVEVLMRGARGDRPNPQSGDPDPLFS